jgi:hypothetical protein
MSGKERLSKLDKKLVRLVLRGLLLDPIYTGVYMFTGSRLTQPLGESKALNKAFLSFGEVFSITKRFRIVLKKYRWQGFFFLSTTGKYTPTT